MRAYGWRSSVVRLQVGYGLGFPESPKGWRIH